MKRIIALTVFVCMLIMASVGYAIAPAKELKKYNNEKTLPGVWAAYTINEGKIVACVLAIDVNGEFCLTIAGPQDAELSAIGLKGNWISITDDLAVGVFESVPSKIFKLQIVGDTLQVIDGDSIRHSCKKVTYYSEVK